MIWGEMPQASKCVSQGRFFLCIRSGLVSVGLSGSSLTGYLIEAFENYCSYCCYSPVNKCRSFQDVVQYSKLPVLNQRGNRNLT